MSNLQQLIAALKSNPELYKQYGFEDFSKLSNKGSWSSLIDGKFKLVNKENKNADEYTYTGTCCYGAAIIKAYTRLAYEGLLRSKRWARTMPPYFLEYNGEPNSDTMRILTTIFSIDNPSSLGKSLQENADISSYILLDYDEICRRGLKMSTIMEHLIKIDKSKFPGPAIVNSEVTLDRWTQVFETMPDFWRIAMVNNRIVGYFNVHLISEPFYSELCKGEKEFIDIMKPYNLLNTKSIIKEGWLYIDVLVVSEDEVLLGNEFCQKIRKELIVETFKSTLQYISKSNFNLKGIIATGYSDVGGLLLRLNKFEPVSTKFSSSYISYQLKSDSEKLQATLKRGEVIVL